MIDAQILVDRYLELERILNIFCSNFDYCLPYCIKQQIEEKGVAIGCCQNKYYKKYDQDLPSYEILKKLREEIYGKPLEYEHIKTPSPCEYHTPEGCVLKTHKSPICNAFFCPEAIEHLREKYLIFNYDYLGIYYGLEWTLDGTFSKTQYEDFRNELIITAEKAGKEVN